MSINLLSTLKSLNMFQPKETIVLALSGGVDSMVLFSLLKSLDLTLVIAHVNHKKREESNQEYDAIKNMGNGSNIIFEGLEITEEIKGNFQQEARKIRYDFFKTIADKYETNKIVLAHHLDDQIESLLMRISKGANIQSFKGMDLKTSDEHYLILRPLIHITKADIEAYAKAHNITYFFDKSNLSDDYTRNRFRNQVLPFFRTENPNFNENMVELFGHFKTITNMIKDYTNDFLKRFPDVLPIDEFITLESLHQHNILMQYFKNKGFEEVLSKHYIQTLIQQLTNSEKNIVIPLNNQWELHKEYKHFFIKKFKVNSKFYYTINALGTYNFETKPTFIVSRNKLAHLSTNFSEIWYNNTVFPLILRNRKPGDKIKLKMGHKKIKDLFIDLKIPPHQRDQIILVCNNDLVVAIPSLGINSFNENKNEKLYIYEVQNVKQRY